MSQTLVIQGKNLRSLRGVRAEKRESVNSKVLSFEKKTERAQVNNFDNNFEAGLYWVGFFTIVFAVFSCAFYLFQVNDLATMGYDIKEAENLIQDLGKENKKMKIRETELKSMYSLEKATEGLNLVNSTEITYLKKSGSVAMNK